MNIQYSKSIENNQASEIKIVGRKEQTMTREERELLSGYRASTAVVREIILDNARRATLKANKERKAVPQLRLVSSR